MFFLLTLIFRFMYWNACSESYHLFCCSSHLKYSGKWQPLHYANVVFFLKWKAKIWTSLHDKSQIFISTKLTLALPSLPGIKECFLLVFALKGCVCSAVRTCPGIVTFLGLRGFILCVKVCTSHVAITAGCCSSYVNLFQPVKRWLLLDSFYLQFLLLYLHYL